MMPNLNAIRFYFVSDFILTPLIYYVDSISIIS